jgi:hypothetical protein
MGLHMLLQILRALEGLPTEVAFVWFKRDMDTDMGGNVVPLDGCRMTISPLTREVQIIRRFTTDMSLANMFLSTRVSAKTRWRRLLLRGLLTYNCSAVAARSEQPTH